MKKIFALLVLCSLSLVMVGCGDKKPAATGGTSSSGGTSTATPASTTTTPAATDTKGGK